MIPDSVLARYGISPNDWGENLKGMYLTFLIQTDYIAAKIAEAQYLGEEPENYDQIIAYRREARAGINQFLSL